MPESLVTSSPSSPFQISIESAVDEACATVPVPKKARKLMRNQKITAELIEIEKIELDCYIFYLCIFINEMN